MKPSILSIINQNGTPLNIFSSGSFLGAYQKMQTYLPMAKHFYALKSLPHKGCIKAIADVNGYLDLATKGEMDLVNQLAPQLFKKSIYTHPVKTIEDIEYAISLGIDTMVADNEYELKKLMPYKNKIKILVRIAFPNTAARCNLSKKFGASFNEAKHLIETGIKSKINIIGCSFHVGSQMPDANMHVQAIIKCKELYNWVYNTYGYAFTVLDIGGGFPDTICNDHNKMQAFCLPIKNTLQSLFNNIEIFAEPGRCIAANSMVNITQIIGKAWRNNHLWYYLDDGVYGTYSGNVFDHAALMVKPLIKNNKPIVASIFAGPTCDSIDVLNSNPVFVNELEIGDYLYCTKIGAYGWASRTQFNHTKEAKIVDAEIEWNTVNSFGIAEQVFDTTASLVY